MGCGDRRPFYLRCLFEAATNRGYFTIGAGTRTRFDLQLSSTTEERDRLKIIVGQLKLQKNVGSGTAMTDGTVKVVE
ncbi:hypothetical protein L1987_80726 [Smallanthus sonchifolius]|uniref:Uncharacterized protein n=1 Tax=Smallanthus sonchifolius TaxID=185202 RepID=A0ACB8YNJ6_9ASTR|nr:hypothetical protein L1987_80726 [Smallanthus sonchifolius]